MMSFHHAVIQSMLRYTILAWFGNISVKLKSQIHRLVHMKVMEVRKHHSLQMLFEKTRVKQAMEINADSSYILYSEYKCSHMVDATEFQLNTEKDV